MTIDLTKHLIDLRGKTYLPVAPRVVAFREEHGDWAITTEVLDGEPRLVRATITDADGRIVATAHKTVTKFAGGDTEKAETGAIGRALSLCGYGTLLALDLDEGDEIADAPIEPPKRTAKSNGTSHQSNHGYNASADTAAWRERRAAAEAEADLTSWREAIDAVGTDSAALLALLPQIAAEPDEYRRAGSLRLWAKAMTDLAGTTELITAGQQIKAWPADTPSRTELLDALRAALKTLNDLRKEEAR
jgi:hypothetical protein